MNVHVLDRGMRRGFTAAESLRADEHSAGPGIRERRRTFLLLWRRVTGPAAVPWAATAVTPPP